LGIEGYYKLISGLTSESTGSLNTLNPEEFYEGDGRAYGVDILLKKRWAIYQTWLSYSWARVEYTFDLLNQGVTFAASHDRPHSLISVHVVNHKNWQFSVLWKYATGKVYTPSTELEFDDDENEFFPLYEDDAINSKRLPHYHRLDASVLYKFSHKKRRLKGTVGLSFLNLYNRKNILSRQYDVGYEDDENGYDEIAFLQTRNQPSLRITPNVVFRLKWE
jgi:hypothetical protein